MNHTHFEYIHINDGLRLRYGRWRTTAAKCCGTVLILSGRTEFLEKYQETIEDLNQRGFDAVGFDWRGQGLSSRLLPDQHKGYVQNYEQYIDDLDLILHKIVQPNLRRPLLVMAHSMGAHITLRFLQNHGEVFDKAVFLAPMINIYTAPIPPLLARWISCRMTRKGRGTEPVLGAQRYIPFQRPFARNRLTTDPDRYHHLQQFIACNPHLVVGTITYSWLAATFNSIDTLRQPGFGAQINVPMLVVKAGQDRLVVNRDIDKFVGQLDHCQTVCIPDARHEILQETDSLRRRFWHIFDSFMRSGFKIQNSAHP